MTRCRKAKASLKEMTPNSTSPLNSDKNTTTNPFRTSVEMRLCGHQQRRNRKTMNEPSCPNCGSPNVRLKPIATRTCGGVGAVTGGIAAAKAGTAGAAIGSAVMPGVGTAIGGLAGIVAGLFTGALSGAAVGRTIDRRIIQSYRCGNCGYDFAA